MLARENSSGEQPEHQPSRLIFDITGMLQWYSYYNTPTGVPRVTHKILVSHTIASHPNVEFIARGLGSNIFFRVPKDVVIDLGSPDRYTLALVRVRGLFARSMVLARPWNLFQEASRFHLPYIALGISRLSRLLEAWGNRKAGLKSLKLELLALPGPGDAIINLGDFWSQRNLVDALVALKKKSGASLVHMIHDLFPISRPDSIYPFFSKIWRNQIEVLAPHVDCWLANSEFVKGTVLDFLRDRNLKKPTVAVVPMGSDSFTADGSRRDADGGSAKSSLVNMSYVLHVGTVEERKNLISLLEAMEAVRRRHRDKTPDLVLVGAPGWQSEVVCKRLEETNNYNNSVHWLKNVNDQELSVLYRGAMFCVVPGIEGWGLPVRESLIHGVPCLASKAGALPEAGGDLAGYFDPADPLGLELAIENWIAKPSVLERLRIRLAQHLKEGLAYPTWDDSATRVIQVVVSTINCARSLDRD